MKPRVSVLLPVFNAVPTLAECLDSLITQKFSDFEVIVVDDGSTDDTADILLKYSRKDPRIRMINTEHSGIVTTLTTAYRYAEASYIARMDADDISLPDRFSRQVELLDDRSDIAVTGCQVGSVPGITLGGGYEEYFRWINDLTEPDEIANNIFVESPMPHPTVMFRKGPYEQVGGYQDHRWPEDYDLWLRMHLAGFKFAKVQEVLVQWRDHPNRFSRRNPRYDVDAFFRAKARYLAQGPLKGIEEIIVWGAGKRSRQRSEYLKEYGIRMAAYIDIDENKIGNTVSGVPIISPDAIEEYPGYLILPFVHTRGARDDIRRKLKEMGKVEGIDFICCA